MKVPNRNFGKRRLISPRLTFQIITLHENGYDLDFFLEKETGQIKDEYGTSYNDFSSKLVDQCFDQLSGTYKYVHAVDTICGRKGLLIADEVFIFPLAVYNRTLAVFNLLQSTKLAPKNPACHAGR
ncbi:hypothetical protein [Pedobacter panaciterrae]|uniref:hypothetical protein n=1 Tax=Pedobacter panaciterrae TaxID=363849 RepID=UPI00259441DA|nr:hypothetical protein [uncultured Pedobacter sp.]